MVTDGLLEWYAGNQRALPWRKNREPYRVWVSEIMLQQTRVEAVIPYYERFLQALPTVEALAEAQEETLLKLWEGLGYYSRVRNMQTAARQIVALGTFPRTKEELKKLKGFGEYTAGAVASIAFSQRCAAVDGNALRIYARMEQVAQSIKMPSVRAACGQAVLAAMPRYCDAGQYNQALMDLGATICTPKGPKCALCPVRAHCGAYAEDEAEEYPIREAKPEKPVEEFDVYGVEENGKIMVRRRADKGLLAGLWEFPHHINGMRPIQEVLCVRHVFTHKIWQMRFVRAERTGSAEGCAFVTREKLEKLAMPSAMEPFRKVILNGAWSNG